MMSKATDELCVNSIGMETFGASAPLTELQRTFGFLPENIVGAAKAQLARARR